MEKDTFIPTEREWLLMEAVWDAEEDEIGLTATEILDRMGGEAVMTARTERVLLHHLCKKGLLAYTVDERDSRVYHYTALRSREDCRQEKSLSFIDTYFRGDGAGAAAAFLKNMDFSDQQLAELEAILEARKGPKAREGAELRKGGESASRRGGTQKGGGEP